MRSQAKTRNFCASSKWLGSGPSDGAYTNCETATNTNEANQAWQKKTTQQSANSAHCQPDQPSKKLTSPIVNPAQSQPGGLAQSKSTRTNANQDQPPMPAQPKANQANLAKSQPAKANPAQSEPGSLAPKSNQAASLSKSYYPYTYTGSTEATNSTPVHKPQGSLFFFLEPSVLLSILVSSQVPPKIWNPIG